MAYLLDPFKPCVFCDEFFDGLIGEEDGNLLLVAAAFGLEDRTGAECWVADAHSFLEIFAGGFGEFIVGKVLGIIIEISAEISVRVFEIFCRKAWF